MSKADLLHIEIVEPTGEQCEQIAKVFDGERNVAYALWYPQMGGYVAKAVAIFDKQWTEADSGATNGGCVDVLVWHDGDWPFHDGEPPRELHHCSPEQFITFGETLSLLNEHGRTGCRVAWVPEWRE